jgi:hypothetical protein
MKSDEPQMKIRLPIELKDKIAKASKDSGRVSMNAEIVYRLEQSFGVYPEGLDSTENGLANISPENRKQAVKHVKGAISELQKYIFEMEK